jgi:hypothetical protein
MNDSLQQIPCVVCATPMYLRISKKHKPGKPSLNLICPVDARHFRAFFNDQGFVKGVLDSLEGQMPWQEDGEGENPEAGRNTESERQAD